MDAFPATPGLAMEASCVWMTSHCVQTMEHPSWSQGHQAPSTPYLPLGLSLHSCQTTSPETGFPCLGCQERGGGSFLSLQPLEMFIRIHQSDVGALSYWLPQFQCTLHVCVFQIPVNLGWSLWAHFASQLQRSKSQNLGPDLAKGLQLAEPSRDSGPVLATGPAPGKALTATSSNTSSHWPLLSTPVGSSVREGRWRASWGPLVSDPHLSSKSLPSHCHLGAMKGWFLKVLTCAHSFQLRLRGIGNKSFPLNVHLSSFTPFFFLPLSFKCWFINILPTLKSLYVPISSPGPFHLDPMC